MFNTLKEYMKLAQLNEADNGHSHLELNDATEKEQLAAVDKDPYLIKVIDNPSEAVQLAVVNKDGSLIKFIDNPSEAVQFAACEEYTEDMKYIKNPSINVQLALVKKSGYSIEYIRKPPVRVQLAAIKQNPNCIQYIKNPTKPVRDAALKLLQDLSPKELAVVCPRGINEPESLLNYYLENWIEPSWDGYPLQNPSDDKPSHLVHRLVTQRNPDNY